MDYLEAIGAASTAAADRRARLHAAMSAIQVYERDLARRLLDGLAARPEFKVWGISDRAKLAERVPTISFTHPRYDAQVLAEHLAERQIYAWNGNMYALELSALLGLEQRGGFLRLGLVHYNTADEVDAVLAALDQLAA